jgi:hypothetical protein
MLKTYRLRRLKLKPPASDSRPKVIPSISDTDIVIARAFISRDILLIFLSLRALSSVGERCLHTAEVMGSNPVAPTRKKPGIRPAFMVALVYLPIRQFVVSTAF